MYLAFVIAFFKSGLNMGQKCVMYKYIDQRICSIKNALRLYPMTSMQVLGTVHFLESVFTMEPILNFKVNSLNASETA